MMKELCAGKKNYLFSGGAGLRSLDLAALNETLGKYQLTLKASMSYSERVVNCHIGGGEWRGRTVFRLDDGKSEPDTTEDAGALTEASQDATVN
jgi:hypothetical protein